MNTPTTSYMPRRIAGAVVVAAILALGGCDSGDKATDKTASSQSPSAPATATPANSAIAPLPDVGKLGTETVRTQGAGGSAAEAVDEAIRLALKQVNGQSVDLSSEQIKLTLSLATGKDAEALRGNVFAEHIVQNAGGAITGFKVISLDGPDSRGFYKTELEVTVAKFTPANTSNKLRIVVAPLRYASNDFVVGNARMPASQVGEAMRQSIIASLTATGRFVVLDRDTNDEIGQELDLIASGQSPRAEFGKLAQALSADVIWVGRIERFNYERHAKQLQTSDRELVSYSGGWSLSHKLVSVTTRQIMLSDSLRGEAPSITPTTLGTNVDSQSIAANMRTEAVERLVSEIVARTFPVTVISRDGNQVVLSQGGQAVRENARYRLVVMGKEMFDPQTNQSLGRIESPCCEVVVERVTPTMAQGRLEKLQMPLDNLQPGSLQLRERLADVPVAPAVPVAPIAPPAAAADNKATTTHPAASGDSGAGELKPAAKPATPERDDKW